MLLYAFSESNVFVPNTSVLCNMNDRCYQTFLLDITSRTTFERQCMMRAENGRQLYEPVVVNFSEGKDRVWPTW